MAETLSGARILMGVGRLAGGNNVDDWRLMMLVLPYLPQSKIVVAFNPARV
jgi:hypothetical protein